MLIQHLVLQIVAYQEYLALGAFLATSDSDAADVECFASEDSTNDPIDMPGCKSLNKLVRYITDCIASLDRNVPSAVQGARGILFI